MALCLRHVTFALVTTHRVCYVVFNTVGIVSKSADDLVRDTVNRLVTHLKATHVTVLVDADSAPMVSATEVSVVDRHTLGERCELAIIIGGDGTFLRAARSLVRYDVRLLGINLGRLGFLTDLMPSELEPRLDEILAGSFEEEKRSLLESSIVRKDEEIVHVDALNDVVAHKWNIARLIQLETYIDERLVHSQYADGLIVSTPTGSTAYALAGGGPILHPGLDAIVLVPICPHTLSNRPIVVGGDSRIEVVMRSTDATPEAQLTCDGQTVLELLPGDRVRVERKKRRLRLIHPPGHDYYATLRTKLHWNWGKGL